MHCMRKSTETSERRVVVVYVNIEEYKLKQDKLIIHYIVLKFIAVLIQSVEKKNEKTCKQKYTSFNKSRKTRMRERSSNAACWRAQRSVQSGINPSQVTKYLLLVGLSGQNGWWNQQY